MILNGKTDVKVLSEGQSQDSIGMQLDLESAHILMTMLSKNLYSDSIGSTIRETASNALDSHRRVGVDAPIIVSFGTNAQNNYEFTVEDFGSGLDENDVMNIISKYGKSTKRNSNNELGCFGLGFKAPLSYSSTFFFVCRKDSIERKYMMYEGEEGNSIDLLYEQVTAEENGVKIIVPVEYKDRHHFVDRIKEQLAYFENVYFNVDGIQNDFTILREEHFQISQLVSTSMMHICLDNVYYPIDWSKLGVKPVDIRIGLRFSLTDGLYPTPSRENLIYSEATKKVILDKIGLVADYMVNKYNENTIEVESLHEIFNYYSGDARYIELDNNKFSINPLFKHTDIKIVKPSLKGVEKLNLKYMFAMKDHFTKEYKVTHRIYNQSISFIKNNYYNSQLREANFPMNNIYIYTEEVSNIKKEYIKSLIGHGEYFMVKKIMDYKLTQRNLGFDSLKSILGLQYHPKEEWRQVIREFRMLQKTYTDQFIDIDTLEPTAEWLESRKKKRVYVATKRDKATGEINCKLGANLERSMSGRSCKFVPAVLQLDDLHKKPNLFIYAKHDDYMLLDSIYNGDVGGWNYITRSNKERLRVLTVSPTEYKRLETLEIHNLISYEKFMEGDNKSFKRIITAQLISQLMIKQSYVFDNINFLKTVSTDLYNKLELLRNYKTENYFTIKSEVVTAMLEVAEEKGLFDTETYVLYIEIKQTLERLSFFNSLMKRFKSNYAGDIEELIPILVDLCKYHKYKVDYIHYVPPVVEPIEEVIEEEDLTV